MYDLNFFLSSILLGVGLAMDAFSVSLANGLNEPLMKRSRMTLMSGIFAVFQFLMPLIGWVCVHTILVYFFVFENFIPWIALALLSYIGGKMIYDGVKGGDEEEKPAVGIKGLLIQGLATSIDALSVGFTIAEYEILQALISTLIIGAVTFFICLFGVYIGKKAGTKLAGKATVFGGILLIAIGLKIILTWIIELL